MGDEVRAAIYCRVSTEEQADPDKPSLDKQRERCEGYCTAQGWELHKVYNDAGVSGRKDDRPAFNELMEDARAGQFKRFVVLKMDRFARRAKIALDFAYGFEELGIGLAFVENNIDTSTPMGKAFFTVAAAFAELESDEIGNRGKDGRKGSARNGRWPASQTPYGYAKTTCKLPDPCDHDKNNNCQVKGRLVEDLEAADVVRRMYDMADEGAGIVAIAARLNEAGVEIPSKHTGAKIQGEHGWQGTVVWRLLTNERYIGKAVYAGVEIKIPALVTEEQFERVGAAMTRRRDDAPKRTKRVYLLQHLLRCRSCGGKLMSRVWSAGKRRYMCSYRVKYGSKGGHEGVVWHIFADDAEARIKKLIEDFMADPENAASRLEVYADQIDTENKKAKAELPGLEKRLADLAKQEDNIVKKGAAGEITDAMITNTMQEIDKDRAGVAARIVELKNVTDFDKNTLRSEWAHEMVKNLRNGAKLTQGYSADWREFQKPEAKRFAQGVKAYIRSFIDVIWLEADGTLTIEGPVQVSPSSS